MIELGRILVLLAALLGALGATLWILGRFGFNGLPGDLRIETRNVRIYFPLATSLLISALLTGLLWLWGWLGRR